MGTEIIKIFKHRVFFVFGYEVDALETAIQKVREIFPKLWRYGTGTSTLEWEITKSED